jgi:hypothetical protein
MADAIGEEHTGNASRRQRGQDTREEGRQCNLGNISSTARGKLSQDTNLSSKGTDVTETLYDITLVKGI